MKRTRAVDLELLFRNGVRDEFRREALADLAKLDKKPELDGADRRHPGPRRPRRRAGTTSVVFDLVRLLTGRDAAELAAARRELEAAGDRRPQAGHPPARLRRPDRRRRRRRQGLGARREVGRLAPGPGRRDAAIRDPGQRAALYPKVVPLLDGLPEGAGRRRQGGEGDRGPIRPDRAPGPADADARRGRGLQRRPERRPAGQGHAEEHRLRRRRRAGDRRQQERRLRRRRPDPHRGEHPEPLVGGRPRRRGPDRLDRRLQPDRRRLRQAARRLHPQGPRRPAATSSSRPPTCRPRRRRPRPRSAGPGRREPSAARR